MEEEIASMETNLHEELHRSSSSSPLCVKEKEANVTGNINNNIFSHEISLSMFSDAQYCYSILEAMPLPGPTWSTTAPCVLAEPQSSTHIEGSLEELEWGENQASSYTWWLGFLESLDDNMSSCEKLDHPFIDKNVEIQDSKLLSFDSSFVDAIDLTSSPDDWLMIPPMEMDLGDMVIP
ncbi:hypothetical protein VNO77_07349 [Canavalia gladiata]|uniref:Uncharacterized protein n=1 Tax=Canavalia gladiata TaxID=3824 RepID=A0AAN9MD25_CANGL